MKLCKNCQRPINRGAAGGTSMNEICLVCRTAQSLATFVYTPTYAPERRGPKRTKRQAASQ